MQFQCPTWQHDFMHRDSCTEREERAGESKPVPASSSHGAAVALFAHVAVAAVVVNGPRIGKRLVHGWSDIEEPPAKHQELPSGHGGGREKGSGESGRSDNWNTGGCGAIRVREDVRGREGGEQMQRTHSAHGWWRKIWLQPKSTQHTLFFFPLLPPIVPRLTWNPPRSTTYTTHTLYDRNTPLSGS